MKQDPSVSAYQSDGQIDFDAGVYYTDTEGIIGFRGNNFRSSPTYGKYVSTLLSAENFRQFYIPAGFAHGFTALEDDTVFAYKCSNFYNKASEGCIMFNDKDLNIDWQIENPITSEKDMHGEAFATFVSPFEY